MKRLVIIFTWDEKIVGDNIVDLEEVVIDVSNNNNVTNEDIDF